ncbi:M20 family metallopeptidase [Paraburkholderia sp. MMS20-SJTN17]|uniref:M20 family metallopeptidase n=1 Tax=Paraburkholderia translucens TaxID=2886945 RepID=A0ABS8KFU2_9BURK|nr:M20 aminoacylase family protein [Paraburkholderia sp. MMS20-SJTN17]MCC8403304.1 M20 family metallopeptidase [Paraburkholderia sp. MMS20-SJTN17]
MSQTVNIHPEIREHTAEFVELRQRIHSHPELGFEEVQTSRLVAQKLRDWGYDVTEGIGGTGVVGQLKVGNGSRKIGIRADMDALPITEGTGLPYASQVQGKMHACGHDGHTAILLATAHYLARTRRFSGTLNLIFQPAEEGLGGALRMMADGLFKRFPCDGIYALHNAPGLPVGKFVVQSGAMAASSDAVTITLRGKGSHGAMPHFSRDPVVAAASIVMALQTIVSRNISTADAAVVTVGAIQAGTAHNVVPSTATILVTVRTLNREVQTLIESRLREIVEFQARSMGVEAEIDYKAISRVLMNTPKETALAREAIAAIVGAENIFPLPPGRMGGEDFSWMLDEVPGCYVALGNGAEGHGSCMLHNPGYDFNDEALPIGVSYWARLVEQYLTA